MSIIDQHWRIFGENKKKKNSIIVVGYTRLQGFLTERKSFEEMKILRQIWATKTEEKVQQNTISVSKVDIQMN